MSAISNDGAPWWVVCCRLCGPPQRRDTVGVGVAGGGGCGDFSWRPPRGTASAAGRRRQRRREQRLRRWGPPRLPQAGRPVGVRMRRSRRRRCADVRCRCRSPERPERRWSAAGDAATTTGDGANVTRSAGGRRAASKSPRRRRQLSCWTTTEDR